MRLLARLQRRLGLRLAIVAVMFTATAGGLAARAAPRPAASSPAATTPAATTPAASPPTDIGQAQQQLSGDQRRVSQPAGTVAGAGPQAGDPGASITALQGRVARLQIDLSARRTQLLRVRHELDAAQTKLGGLGAAKGAAERALGEELVGNYEAGRPDIISVVLESNGFADLLERLAFAQRVSRQDAGVVARVRSARRAVATEAKTLGELTTRAQNVAESARSEQDHAVRYRLRLVAYQLAAAKARAAAAGQLPSARVEVDQLTQQLDTLRAAQPPASATSRAGAGSTTTGAGRPFPLPPVNAAPPATWSLGNGVNIAAPAGTPELAVCSGTIVLHGIGGLGPSTPVLRCDQSLFGHSYVYYGFAGARRLAPIGADVARGQPLARVGAGTIGTSSGPHLEIGFADSSGAPLGSAAAAEMLILLHAAYAT